MIWIGHPAIVYSIQRWFSGVERVLVAINTRRKYSECVTVRVSGVTNRPAKWNRRKAMKTFVEKKQAGIIPAVFQGLLS